MYGEMELDITQFGRGNIHDLGRQCSSYLPKLAAQDVWRKLLNGLHTCEAWKNMAIRGWDCGHWIPGKASRMESIVSISLRLHLYEPSFGLYSCLIAITFGTAKLIQL